MNAFPASVPTRPAKMTRAAFPPESISRWRWGAPLAIYALLAAPCVLAQAAPAPSNDALPIPLTATPGDVARGRALVADRHASMCVLCHQVPIAEVAFQGDISTNLAGAGSRWSVAQLRARIVDARQLNPDTVMPSYHRVQGLQKVGRTWVGKPILDAQQVEDVVAYLASLK